eukprot:scaffold1868_cov178-Amphora_coffeaeformis.AAC.6
MDLRMRGSAADCQGGVKDTFHALTAGNCSDTSSWGTACLTEDLVALTQFDTRTCQKTAGSVQRTSQCVPGGQRNGRNVWIYCTSAGCDDFGATCPKVLNQGAVKVWDACESDNDYYIDPIPADNECYAIPDVGASVRMSCINNLYIQAVVYSDTICSNQNGAPQFLEQVGNMCYPLRGPAGSFGLTVDKGCSCEGDRAMQEPIVADNALRYDVVYNLTIDGSTCLDGTALDDLRYELKQQTRVQDVELSIGAALLDSDRGWTINIAIRFQGIPESNVFLFQEDVDTALDDGRVLQMVESKCGGNNVTLLSHGSNVWDHEPKEEIFLDSGGSVLQHWGALMTAIMACSLLRAIGDDLVSVRSDTEYVGVHNNEIADDET